MYFHPHVRAFLYALQFLTRIPVPALDAPTEQDQARSALYYPAVGLLIGLILATIALILPDKEPMLLAAILLIVWAAVTGALHLDGLADSADAWLGSNGDANKAHRILKDPLVGTAGVVAILVILLIKYSALYVLLKEHNYAVIVLAPVLGRSLTLLVFLTTEYVRDQGLASAMVNRLNTEAVILCLIPVGLLAAWFSFSGLVLVALVYLALRRMMIKQIGGCTGDTAGATLEIGEAFWLLGAALF